MVMLTVVVARPDRSTVIDICYDALKPITAVIEDGATSGADRSTTKLIRYRSSTYGLDPSPHTSL